MKVLSERARILITCLALLALTSCNSRQNRNDDPPGTGVLVDPLVTQTQSAPQNTTQSARPIETSVTAELKETLTPQKEDIKFDGEAAFQHLADQVNFGPRVPESEAHQAAADLILDHLSENGWSVSTQEFAVSGVNGRNIIGKTNQNAGPIIILGTHYDTRAMADRSANSSEPVLGAVDGASGAAVLLELARVLELEKTNREIWLVFFDLEDQGGVLSGLDFIEGSRYMADNLETMPEAVVVVDMVGDSHQDIYYEGYSDPILNHTLWSLAEELGYGQYLIPEVGRTIRDDHLPFLQKGIPASVIIDFNYPYWHTTEDTIDKSHPDSLNRVGSVLENWLENMRGD